MHSLRTDLLAAAWALMTTAAWLAPFAFAHVWTVPVAVCVIAGLAAGACLPRGWLRPRNFQRLGVRRFKRVVVFGDRMNRMLRRMGWSRPFPSTPERMRRWLLWTEVAERIHWSWLLGSLPVIYAAFRAGRSGLGAYVLCGNVPFNIYPILLQRHTRARIERILSAANR